MKQPGQGSELVQAGIGAKICLSPKARYETRSLPNTFAGQTWVCHRLGIYALLVGIRETYELDH